MKWNLQNRSTRELQAYGAACIAAFSNAFGLAHTSIRELVEHLLRVIVVKDLPDGSRKGRLWHFPAEVTHCRAKCRLKHPPLQSGPSPNSSKRWLRSVWWTHTGQILKNH